MRKSTLAETDMSDIEKEFEIEMDEPDERFFEEDPDQLFEMLSDEDEPESGYTNNGYAERLYELSLKEFESISEIEGPLSKILGEMEKDFFLKGLRKSLKKKFKFAKRLLKIPLVRSAITTGLNIAAPGSGTLATRLGFEAGGEPEENREAWNNFVYFAQEAYDNLAENLDEGTDRLMEDNQPINQAIKYGLNKLLAHQKSPESEGDVKVVYLKKGEKLLIKRI